MEQKADEHPLVAAIREALATGTMSMAAAKEELALLKNSNPAQPVAPGVTPPPPAPDLGGTQQTGLDASRYFKTAHPELGGAFFGQPAAPNEAPRPNNIQQIYQALAGMNPQGFNEPGSELWNNARAYARQNLGVEAYNNQLAAVPRHPGSLNMLGRIVHGYGASGDPEADINRRMNALRMFGNKPDLQALPPQSASNLPSIGMRLNDMLMRAGTGGPATEQAASPAASPAVVGSAGANPESWRQRPYTGGLDTDLIWHMLGMR
jgi:hypothetical protein